MDLDLQGHFWLPDQEDDRVRGRLSWSAAEGGELTLEGALAPGGQVAGEAARLCGRGLDGTPLALVNAFVRQFQAGSELVQRWRVNEAFLGTFDAAPEAQALALEIEGLATFTQRSGLSVEGTVGPRDPAHIVWAPADPLLTLAQGAETLEIVDERQLDLDEQRFAIEHAEYLRLTVDQPTAWTDLATRLGLAAALLEFLADRPMMVRRQWRPGMEESPRVAHFFQPVLGKGPEDPDKLWLTLPLVESGLSDALQRWSGLAAQQEGLVNLVVEEVRFGRATSAVDRILRISRIIELLHRHRHPDAEPEDDDEAENVQQVLDAAKPAGLDGWLGDRLGVSHIRLRQRIRETLAELSGLEAMVIDVDQFARVVTKTRNWHTHYSDPAGIATGHYLASLAMRLSLLARGALLLGLGWSSDAAVALVQRDGNAGWLSAQPLMGQ